MASADRHGVPHEESRVRRHRLRRISTAYLKAAQRFANLELRAVADMRSAAAEKRGAEFGVPAMRVDQLLKRDDIEIVVNLTVPLAHTDVSLAVLRAGKHVHSEKPLGVNVAEARKVMDLAAEKNLRVGCAPDTFLGGGHQTARKLIDDGAIGKPVAGTAFFMCPGHERWHPAPGFYYLRGGGPMLDMGPYYITDLIQLLGPIASVMGSTAQPRARARDHQRADERNEDSGRGRDPRRRNAGIRERRGRVDRDELRRAEAQAHADRDLRHRGRASWCRTPTASAAKSRSPRPAATWEPVAHTHGNVDGEFRSIGVADMAAAIVANRPHRASGALALHALEAMEAFQTSADEGRRVKTRNAGSSGPR